MTPIVRVHMVDACRQTLEERANLAHRRGDFIAGMVVGAVVFGALAVIVVRLWGKA